MRRPDPRPFPGRRRPGQTLVLFALLFPVLLGMVGLVIDGGLIMAAQRQVQNAADAAALAASMDRVRGKTDAAHPIAVAIRPAVVGLIDPSRVDLRVDWLEGGNDVGQRVRVTASTPWTPLVLFVFGSQPRTLVAASTMPIAH